jgi:hypothetical protein
MSAATCRACGGASPGRCLYAYRNGRRFTPRAIRVETLGIGYRARRQELQAKAQGHTKFVVTGTASGVRLVKKLI